MLLPPSTWDAASFISAARLSVANDVVVVKSGEMVEDGGKNRKGKAVSDFCDWPKP